MSAKAEKVKLGRWRHGAAGFFAWLDDVKPMVPSARGGYEPFVPGARERVEIEKALDGGYNTAVFCWPRRHGKTLVSALIIIWRFMTRRTENVAVVANSEKQIVDTAFRLIRTIIEQTPAIKAIVEAGAIKVGLDKIEYAAAGSLIQAFSASPNALWGKKLTVAQISELHATNNEAVLEALAGSLLDSFGSLLLIDSTVGPRSSPLFGLYQTAQNGDDPRLFFSHIQYDDLEDACARSPHWIRPEELRSLAKKMLPQRFGSYHLNRWQDGSASLFPADILKQCVDTYPIDVKAITAGGAYVVGGGLDRAFGGSRHGDATIATAVLKTVIDEDEHFYVLASEKVLFSRLSGIKNALTSFHRNYEMSRLTVEAYNAQDVGDWAAGQPYHSETIHPTRQVQNYAFTTLYTAAAEGRLHIHPDLQRLLSEMGTFEVHHDNTGAGQAGLPAFRHAKGCRDDAVYSLAWAVHSLREVELSPYEMTGIHCFTTAPVANLCVLNGGSILPPCAESCRSAHTAHKLHAAYLDRKPIAPMSFDEFFASKIKNTGAHTISR